jgi:hypothetical protein
MQGKLEHQFSGADENGLKQNARMVAQKAEAMDIEVSLGALEAFYQEHDPSKLNNVDEIYEKYPAYKLVQVLRRPRLCCVKEAGGWKGGSTGGLWCGDVRVIPTQARFSQPPHPTPRALLHRF